MEQNEQLSLSWDAHQKSICNGLSLLQQKGEFVDMTLAADGHHVKVHQMVLSLVSPYIKDLISTAQCTHPIIFLNNISYTTLCAILEYIYTGEVHVPRHRLPDLIAAGKALHIKGLREMDDTHTADSEAITKSNPSTEKPKSISEKLRAHREKKKAAQPKEKQMAPQEPMCRIYLDETKNDDLAMQIEDSSIDIQDECTAVSETTFDTIATLNNSDNGQSNKILTPEDARKLRSKTLYTVSNQGGLQAIYNRYIYQLRYVSKDCNRRSWRCVDYNKSRCSASILTNENDEVVERKLKHNHPFHDKNILRKLRIGMVYSKYQEASKKTILKPSNRPDEMSQKVQFSVNNQGGLQVIHNRFIYHLRYFAKKNRKRLWRCIDYSSNLKCPANIFTDENNRVTERSFTHNHGFHDNKILKKLQKGIIYSIFQEAENKADGKKKQRRVPLAVSAESADDTE